MISAAKTIGGGQIQIRMEDLQEEDRRQQQKVKPSKKPSKKAKPKAEQQGEEEEKNWRQHPLEKDAHKYYHDNDLEEVLPWPAVLDYAWSLERKIRLDEIELIAGPDGAMVKCAKTGVIYQPKFGIMPTKEVRQAVSLQGDIIRGLYTLEFLPCRGCFYEQGPYFGKMYSRGGDHPGDSPLVKRAKEEARRLKEAGQKFEPRNGERRGFVWGKAITFSKIRQRIVDAVEG